jgi:uncharacterized protein with NRDE domain
MCIALLTTAHPSYALILLDNRDEYLDRPTAPLSSWAPDHPHVYGGRDLQRSIRGTWLGCTTTGRIAVLTNFREDQPPVPNAVSRGAIIRKFLIEKQSTEQFVAEVVDSGIARDAGGFSLVCGRLGRGERLAIVSNRAEKGKAVPWVGGDVVQTVGLSNAAFGNRSWPKVVMGEEMLLDAVRESMEKKENENQMIDRFLDLLSADTLPRHEGKKHGGQDALQAYLPELRKSIFIPPLGRKKSEQKAPDPDVVRSADVPEAVSVIDGGQEMDSGKPPAVGVYGTQKQSVVLVRHDGKVRFFERTLWDQQARRIEPGKGDVDITFQVEV